MNIIVLNGYRRYVYKKGVPLKEVDKFNNSASK